MTTCLSPTASLHSLRRTFPLELLASCSLNIRSEVGLLSVVGRFDGMDPGEVAYNQSVVGAWGLVESLRF